jgi:hypothetical protein
MRFAYCIFTLVIALAATAGIAYFLGHSRALGHEAWRFEERLVRAYASEIPLHAGPLWVLALAAIVALFLSARSSLVVLVSTVIVGGLSLYAVRETVRAYIVAAPGSMMRAPSAYLTMIGLLWFVSLCVLVGVLIAYVRRTRGPSRAAGQPLSP